MADFGALVTLKGYDAESCPDRFLAFSSSFQNLKTFARYSVSTTIPASGTNTITINHNLGDYAPFLVVYNDTSNNKAYFMSGKTGYSLHNFIRQYQNKLEIDVDNAYASWFGSVGQTAYFTVYIFLDDFATVSEEILSTAGSAGGAGNDYGIRVSKDGYDADNCTDDQLAFSSSFFTALINKKGISDTAGLATISHNLGYAPSALAYGKKDGESFIKMAEGMPFYLNPMFGGRTGLFYAVDDTDLTIGYNDLDVVEFSAYWRTDYTFYYIIFKQRSDG
jgi:hypothetical protein